MVERARMRFSSNSNQRMPREAQPRPALGRRPWFAFLRRARSLRRFALVMAARRVTATSQTPIRGPVSLSTDHWRRDGVAPAEKGPLRRRGLIPAPWHRALLFRARCIHTFGMIEPLSVVGLDAEGRVVHLASVRPRSVKILPRAVWVLEMASDEPWPAFGSRVSLSADLTRVGLSADLT